MFRYREKRSLPCRGIFTRWVHDSGINYSSFQIADVPGMNYNVRHLSKKPHIGKQIWTQKRIIFLSEVLSLSSYRGQDSSARATETVKGLSALQHNGLQGAVCFNVSFQLVSISSISRTFHIFYNLKIKEVNHLNNHSFWKHILVTLNPIFKKYISLLHFQDNKAHFLLNSFVFVFLIVFYFFNSQYSHWCFYYYNCHKQYNFK